MVVSVWLPLANVPIAPEEILWKVVSVMVLIAINAFFVMAEFAIVSVRRSRISQLVDAGDVQARTVQELQTTMDRLLSTTQLGITLSSLALGWIGESTVAVLVQDWLHHLPLPETWRVFGTRSLSLPIAFFLVAYLQIVLGELCPKSVAMLYAEDISRVLAPLSVTITRTLYPFVWILNQSTKLLLRFVGIRYSGQGWYNQVTSEEIQLMIATPSESMGLQQEERELLTNVFEFREVTVSEVMIRRPSMTTVPVTATVRDLMEEVARSNHSRYPVIDDSLDDVCGVIHLKELAEPLVQGTLSLDSPIQPWIRPARFVPEYTSMDELLALMQRSRRHLVIVVDEFGSTAGLVTLQDVITQIIGDTPDHEADTAVSIQRIDPNTFLVQAQVNLEEVNDTLQIELPIADEYRTLGGFLLYQWQRIPNENETLQYGNCELTIVRTEGPRLDQVQIHRIEHSNADLPEP
ncbi:MAG: hemolysin family protein [Synechococcales bacterium]|nr:hemolysin family protein [Synechococcales bacterium]